MARNKLVRPIVWTAAIGVTVLIALTAMRAGDKNASPKDAYPGLKRMERIADEVGSLGEALDKIVADPKQPAPLRCRCAIIMSKLRYQPGVKTLIRHVNLHDPDKVPTMFSDFPTEIYVGRTALINYGEAAVPQVAVAFATTHEGSNEYSAYLDVLDRSRTLKPAIRIVRGILAETDEFEKQASLRRRVGQLSRYLKQQPRLRPAN